MSLSLSLYLSLYLAHALFSSAQVGGRFGCSFFFCLGRGKGEFEAPGGGGGIGLLFKFPGGGGFQEGERPRGREGVCGELGNLLGVGCLIFFFRGRNVHQDKLGALHKPRLRKVHTPGLFWRFGLKSRRGRGILLGISSTEPLTPFKSTSFLQCP